MDSRLIINLGALSLEHVKKLNNINNEIKDEYHDILESIYSRTDNSIFWNVNSIFSRYNYISNVFIDLCYLKLIKDVIKKEKIEKIICNTNYQKKVIKQAIKHSNPSIKVTSNEKLLSKIYLSLNPLKDFLKNIKYMIKFLMMQNKMRSLTKINNKEIILIDTFFIDSMFKNGKLEDRYYPGMIKNSNEDIKDLIFFVPNVQIKKNLRNCLEIAESSKENFIYKFDFLLLRDYISALLAPLLVKKIKFKKLYFFGSEVGDFFKADFYKNISHPNSFIGLLNFFFFKRLHKKNCKIKLAVNWFENQLIDKGFNKGLSTFYPNTKTIGYQGFISSYDYEFQLQPTILEKKTGTIPKSIAVVGKGLINDVKKFCNDLNVMTAPGFRMSSVYSIKPCKKKITSGRKNILVVLSISKRDNDDVLKLILQLEQKINNKFIIKPHPSNDITNFNIDNENFKLFNKKPEEIINKIDIVIGNTSSLCLESLIYGKPVIIIGSQSGITQNPIPASISKEIWDLCYDINDLEKSYYRLVEKSDAFFESDLRKRIRKNYIEKISKKNVNNFLKL